MAKTTDVGDPVRTIFIVYRDIDNFEVKTYCSKNKVEVAKEGAIRCDGFVILFPEHLGTAESVFNRLTQYCTESKAKEFIGKIVQQAHRLLFKWVYEA